MKTGIILSLFCLNACCVSYGHAQEGGAFWATFAENHIVYTSEGVFFPPCNSLYKIKEPMKIIDLSSQEEKHEEEMMLLKTEVQLRVDHLNLLKKVKDKRLFEAAIKNIQAFLIEKMIEEKQKQDNSLSEAQKVLQFNKLWDGAAESLFNIAWGAVTTNSGSGVRNFLIPAVAEIIKFSVNKGFQAYAMWDQYNYWIRDAEYHASVFDYYMGQLKAIQGC